MTNQTSPQPLRRDRVAFEEDLPPGGKWSHALRRHDALRLTAAAPGANVSALFYNRDLLSERYNMPDTLKAQYTAFLTKGRALLSDMGRVLCSITDDTCGWHDTLCGHTDAATIAAKYGATTYQKQRNEWHRNAHDSFLIELGKWGLGRQDVVANVNFFSKVTAAEDGKLIFAADHARSGGSVDLRAEMNVLVVLVSSPHPLAPAGAYAPAPVKLTVYRADPPADDDPCRTSRAEVTRAFENTERLFV